MGDPICKWRNASVRTTVELVSELPKVEMTKKDFSDFMNGSIYGKAFNRTAYQLACQLGLYYIDKDGIYHPRFKDDISYEEAQEYLHHWIKFYYVPNPYTAKKFNGMNYSLKLIYALANLVKEHPDLSNLKTACNALFGETTGNILNIKYIINEYSNFLKVDDHNDIQILLDVNEDAYVGNERCDKKAFFEIFNR